MKISIAIITHNEEKNIVRCLSSVYNWVDEIIVVDGQSSDNTVKLIKEFDQKKIISIFYENNPPNFIINKQKAIDRCSGAWILELDADEILSKELKEEILTIVGSSNPPIAYRIPRLNYFLGSPLKKGGQYPDYTIRLYKNGTVRFPCKTIHDQVIVIDPKATIGTIHHPIIHYPYPDFETYLRKWIQYATFEANILIQQEIKPSFWNMKKYFFVLPTWWFFKTHIRHKGFQDGFPGFVFSLFSSMRYWVIYVLFVDKQSTHSKSKDQEAI